MQVGHAPHVPGEKACRMKAPLVKQVGLISIIVIGSPCIYCIHIQYDDRLPTVRCNFTVRSETGDGDVVFTLKASRFLARKFLIVAGAASCVVWLSSLSTTTASPTCPIMGSETANVAASATSGCCCRRLSTCTQIHAYPRMAEFTEGNVQLVLEPTKQ